MYVRGGNGIKSQTGKKVMTLPNFIVPKTATFLQDAWILNSPENEKIISSYAHLIGLEAKCTLGLRVLRQVTKLPTLCALENLSF